MGNCEDPTSPPNGNVEVNECKRVARFSCMTDYTLAGEANVTCDDSGSWTADFPTCEHGDNSAHTGNDGMGSEGGNNGERLL